MAGADGRSSEIDRPEAGGVLRVIQRSRAARPQADALDEDVLFQDVFDRLTDVHQDLDRFSMGVDP